MEMIDYEKQHCEGFCITEPGINLPISQRKLLHLSEVLIMYTLKIKAIFTSEKLVNFNQTA